MLKTLTPSTMTEGQKVKFNRLVEDIVIHAAKVVVSQIETDTEGWQRFLANGDKVKVAVTSTFVNKAREFTFTYGEQVSDWIAFYRKYFNLDPDLSGLEIPDHQEGFDRLIVVAKGLTLNQVFGVCKKQFPCYRYLEDLDNAIRPDDRCAQNGAYAIWVRDRIEADEENKNQSFNKRRTQVCDDENILERVVHELKYFDETGKHLDINNWTLTSSLWSSGSAVYACWSVDRFYVGWNDPDYSFSNLRARSAVSCRPKPSGAKA